MKIEEKRWDAGMIKGWNLYDEPNYPMWGDATHGDLIDEIKKEPTAIENWNRLSIGFRICRELTPGMLTYFNLSFPRGVDRKVIGDCENYEQFLDVLQELYKPALWSYDVYPIVQDKGNSTIIVQHAHFYRALKVFSDQARNTDTRFWAYALPISYECYKGFAETWQHRRPMPTQGTLRFEIFSALACGAQGIIYFRPAGWPIEVSEDVNFRKGETDENVSYYYTVAAAVMYKDGKVCFNEDILKMMKTVNAEVQEYKEVFLDAKLEGLYHAARAYSDEYESDNIPVAQGIAPYFAITICDSDGAPVSDKTAQGLEDCGVLMTILSKKSDKYVVIVSHDPYKRQQIKLTFADTTYNVVNPSVYSASPMTIPPTIQDLSPRPGGSPALSGYYILEAGGYLIIKVGGGK